LSRRKYKNHKFPLNPNSGFQNTGFGIC
jgi:hypothetical protein